MAGRRSRASQSLLRLGMGLGWLIAACLLALGSAGIVAGIDHPPGTARPELTWAADKAIEPGLDAAVADLARLSKEVDNVGSMGRLALASLTNQDVTGLSAAVGDGTTLVDQVTTDTQSLRLRLEALPGAGQGNEQRVGPSTLQRYDRIVVALTATSGLQDDWTALAGGADLASQLTVLLASHDRLAAEAARDGSTGKYQLALTGLGQAEAALSSADKLRATLANSADTSTLDEWIKRNQAMDSALHDLYTALIASRGLSTDAVHKAIAAEKAAQASLPPDTRALVVIMSDIARGGLNQAVISIEAARGRLADALNELEGADSAGPTPTPPGS